MRHNAFDVKGIKTKAIWEVDHDFVNIAVQFMLTIGSNVYMQLSNNTIWKRDSGANYTQIKSGLNMAGGAVCSLGNDGGQLIIDSQHSGADRLYLLDDDGTLTLDNSEYASSGYAGLIHNGSYLFWVRDIGATSKGSVRKSGSWEQNAVSAHVTTGCWIDQIFQSAIPGVNWYFSGVGDYLTTTGYVGTCPLTHNFGVFNSKLYGCNADGAGNDLHELSTYAGGWGIIATTIPGTVKMMGCYGYGAYLYVSGWDFTTEFVHKIYRWNGTLWELDSTLSSGTRTPQYNRFVMVGGTLLCCAHNRVMRKKIA
jgi:hypothetical protein